MVEAWEPRDRGGCSTAFDGWERESTLSTGAGESESEMQEPRKRERKRGRVTMRENGDGCSQREGGPDGEEAKASHSGM